jgi:hypothetical protein
MGKKAVNLLEMQREYLKDKTKKRKLDACMALFVPISQEELADINKNIEFAREDIYTRFLTEMKYENKMRARRNNIRDNV